MENFECIVDYTEKNPGIKNKKLPSESELIIQKARFDVACNPNHQIPAEKLRIFEELLKIIENHVQIKHGIIKSVINYDYMYMHIQATLPHLDLSTPKSAGFMYVICQNADFVSIEPAKHKKINLHVMINCLDFKQKTAKKLQ